MEVLVTGGAGYIGSHTLVELVHAGHNPVVVDSLINSSSLSLRRVEKITGRRIPFFKLDLCDTQALRKVFDAHDFDAVIHFAGLKAVGESVQQPLAYYRNNIDSTLSLCEVMAEYDVHKLLFSSTAVVYGTPEKLPLTEESPVGIGITNPYGQTKYMIEQILRDATKANPGLQITVLRYFNPIGSHPSGLIGEDPNGIPNNLLPYVAQVAVGKLDKIRVFGDDYNTPDGTGVRDYIHVTDVARGHLAALGHMPASGVATYNLGMGAGTSVFEIIRAFEKACGKKLPYEVAPRRPGDIASCYEDVSKAERELSWRAEKTIEEACADTWRWQSQNPNGYATSVAKETNKPEIQAAILKV